MTEEQEYDKALREMAAEPLDIDEQQHAEEMGRQRGGARPAQRSDDGRYANPGGPREGAGRKIKPKTLLIDGVLQEGRFRLVSVTADTITVVSIHEEVQSKFT